MFSQDAEQAVLGSIFNENRCLDEIALQPHDFHLPEHQELYRRILDLKDSGKPFDAIIVSQGLEQEQQEYALSLEFENVSTDNVIAYSKAVKNWSTLRAIKALGQEIASRATNPDRANEILLYVSEQIEAIEGGGATTKRDQSALLMDVVNRLEQYAEGEAPGFPTEFKGLDKILNPLEGGSLTVVAGRPAMGKTAFASQLLMNQAQKGLSVAMFSLEMSAQQIMERNIANLGRVDLNELRNGAMGDKGWCAIACATYQISKSKFYIEERARTVAQVREKCFEIKRDSGLDMICIDYLQLMNALSAENRTTEISTISRGLKCLAMDMKIPVIALSQLNRGLEQRQDKRPMMSDLRESGAIEQDADNIIFIYRDEVYHDNSPDTGRAELIVSKQRSGPTGMHKVSFIGPFTRFEE